MPVRPFETHTPAIDARAYVDSRALVIGNVTVGADSSIWPMTVVRGDVHRIEIGARTNIQDGSILHCTHDSEYSPGGQPLTIGNDITIGHQAVVHACTIENLCLIGIGAIVMDGAVVGARAMVGAGSLVPPGKALEGGYLWVGRPVECRRALTDKELAYLEYSAAHYVQIAKRHIAAASREGHEQDS